MEMQKVPEAGYPIEGLWISGIQRRLTLDNLAFPFKLLSSMQKASGIVKKFQPHAAVGVGGYASGPLLKVASKRGIPCLLQEQNSYAGLTNKLLAKRAQKICVAYEGMEQFFDAEKIVLTGNPVRKDIVTIFDKRDKAFEFFKLDPSKPTLFVMGGSLGARTINQSILAGFKSLIDAGVQLIWQTGKLYYDEITTQLGDYDTQHIRHFEFLREMDYAYAAADMVVSRAGALSISELCLVKKPVIFVPSPNVAEDHQTKNARALVDKDAALMVKDIDAPQVLASEVLGLFGDEAKMKTLAENIGKMGRPNATEHIVEELIKLIS